MNAATLPIQRPDGARLLVVDSDGALLDAQRADLVHSLEPGDLLVANDAATLPASLDGVHRPSGSQIEVRLAGWLSLTDCAICRVKAVVFGPGDHHTPTEDRPLPPTLHEGDVLTLGPLEATVARTLEHPRLVELHLAGSPASIWAGIAAHGKPIQYAHVDQQLALWDVWTQVAALPVAFEPPSAGFVLDWQLLAALKARGIEFATLTHAAGISSTGDRALDARLPFDEPYHLPISTVNAVTAARARGGRVIALGTTVTRALEHAASKGLPLLPGPGVADQRIGPHTELQLVDAIVTGLHEPGDSHYEILQAFADDQVLQQAREAFEGAGYRSHEFGDSLMLARQSAEQRSPHPPDRHLFLARLRGALSVACGACPEGGQQRRGA